MLTVILVLLGFILLGHALEHLSEFLKRATLTLAVLALILILVHPKVMNPKEIDRAERYVARQYRALTAALR